MHELSMARMNAPKMQARLNSKLADAPNGCMEFVGYRDRKGYGKTNDGTGRGGRLGMGAHRLAWELCFGPVPDGMLVCHRCDNPPCCNPLHLFIGTPSDNMADRDRKGRTARIYGESNPRASLSAAHVSEIRRRYWAGGISQRSLGREFGVSQGHISVLVRGLSRKHG